MADKKNILNIIYSHFPELNDQCSDLVDDLQEHYNDDTAKLLSLLKQEVISRYKWDTYRETGEWPIKEYQDKRWETYIAKHLTD